MGTNLKEAATMAEQNTPTPQTPTPAPKKTKAPLEAYAAFVRIYMAWMNREEDEQFALLEQSVRGAKKVSGKYSPVVEGASFGRRGSILFDVEFDEYVDEVCAKFLEKCNDVDKFAEYLQKDFNKNIANINYLQECQLLFDKIRDKYLERVFAEWDSKTKNLYGNKLDEYLSAEYEKRSAEFARIKKEFEDTVAVGYPSLQTLLHRPAQNFIGQLDRQNQKENKAGRADSLEGMAEKGIIKEAIYGEGIKLEERKILQDVLKSVEDTLDAKSKEIVELFRNDPKIEQVKIAEELGISGAAVSKRLKKIRAKLEAELKD